MTITKFSPDVFLHQCQLCSTTISFLRRLVLFFPLWLFVVRTRHCIDSLKHVCVCPSCCVSIVVRLRWVSLIDIVRVSVQFFARTTLHVLFDDLLIWNASNRVVVVCNCYHLLLLIDDRCVSGVPVRHQWSSYQLQESIYSPREHLSCLPYVTKHLINEVEQSLCIYGWLGKGTFIGVSNDTC